MAIYHCSVKIIGRSSGRSSVAAAAYRAAEKLTNEYDGVEHDFTKKHWVEYKEIMLPKNAPKDYKNRATLWNAVETAEKSANAQLAREFELALPIELSREEQIEVVRQFVEENLVAEGMCADIVIHNPPVTNDRHQPIDEEWNVTNDISKMQFKNPHAHILATVRPIDEHGKWEKKSEVQYLCKRNDEEKAFTSSEFAKAKDDGWEKQYQYYEGKKKVYLTTSEAYEKDLKRVSRAPKTTPYGKKNEKVERWNSKDSIFIWRESWEKIVNDKFESLNSELRIDSRSYKNQGKDELPTLHMGTSANNMEKRADRLIHEGKSETEVLRSDIGNINRQIREHNKFIRVLKSKLKELADKAKNTVIDMARHLESLRAKLIGDRYEENSFASKINMLKPQIVTLEDRLETYYIEMQKIDEANNVSSKNIKALEADIESCSPLNVKKKSELKMRIKAEREKIEQRLEYSQRISRICEINSIDEYKSLKKEYDTAMKEMDKIRRVLEDNSKDQISIKHEIVQVMESIPDDIRESVKAACIEERVELEKIVIDKLTEAHGADYKSDLYETAKKEIDEIINSLLEQKEDILSHEKEVTVHRHM